MARLLLIQTGSDDLNVTHQPTTAVSASPDEIIAQLKRTAEGQGAELRIFQSNSEGAIIDAIQDARNWATGIIIDPGTFGHTSYAMLDALLAVKLPTIEVHQDNIFEREDLRNEQVLTSARIGMICGFGWRGYLYAVQALLAILEEQRLERAK